MLLAAKAGAPWACTRLYEDLAGTVAGYLRRQGAREPEDVTSETFLDVFRNLPSFHGHEEQFRSWVFTIAHRRLIDERRRLGRRPRETSIEDAPDPPAPRVTADDGSDWSAVGRHLVGLTDEQRDVVLLRVVAGLSAKETAAVVDKSPAAVRQLQRRGLRTLEQQLHANGADLLER